jgi:uncharacterized membrane protein
MNVAGILSLATIVGTLGTGIIGGVFFAFSTFVMRALARLPANQGIAAMQHINLTVLNPWFLGTFTGTALLCVLIAIMAMGQGPSSTTACLIIGAVLYVIGTFVATIVFNVPKNDALAALSAETASSATYWNEYLVRWTFWNHVRTVCALGATASFAIALTLRS